MNPHSVLVVGAGPVGLTAACQLTRWGVPVRVVDVLPHPTTQARAAGVHARTLEMFGALGVLPRLETLGVRISSVEILDGTTGHRRASVSLGGVASRHPYILDVPQSDTEMVLTHHLAASGVLVERGVELTALSQDDEGVDVEMVTPTGSERTRWGWVIGADGARSTTRTLVGDRLRGDFHGQHFVLADVAVETALSSDAVRMFTHPRGMGMVFPLPEGRARVGFFIQPPTRDSPTLEEFQALALERTRGLVDVSSPTWLGYFEVRHGQVDRYRHGRVFLAGDAAHIHSPAGGQGMNTGVQDAANLAWKLALVTTGRAQPALLDSYHDERHPVAKKVVRATTLATNVGTVGGPIGHLRNVALSWLGHLDTLNSVASPVLTQVDLHYRRSPLSTQHGTAARCRVRAGDHAPDPDGLTRPDGRDVSIEDLLLEAGLLLLTRSRSSTRIEELARLLGETGTVVQVVDAPDEQAATSTPRVVDTDGAIARAYGIGAEGMALIRPDGYLGLVVTTSAATELLADYLTTTLRTRTSSPAAVDDIAP